MMNSMKITAPGNSGAVACGAEACVDLPIRKESHDFFKTRV